MQKLQQGQILITSLIFMVVMIFLSGALFGFVGQNVFITRDAVANEVSFHLAEAGIEKALWQLNETAGSYTGEEQTVFGQGEFDVIVNPISTNLREIVATGYYPNKSSAKAEVSISVRASIDTSTAAFNYGVQVGEGGLVMSNNTQITGNVYSNGVIDGASGARITGDAISAGTFGRITDNLQIDGNAYAHTIDDDISVGGNAYAQSLDSVTVGGSAFTNSMANCTVGGNASYTTIDNCTVGGNETTGYPGEVDPEAKDFPIPDEQITDWKSSAEGGGTIVGNYTVSGLVDLGPKRITGNLVLNNNSTLNIQGPIWVQGNIQTGNNSIIKLDDLYGDNSEAIIADGEINATNNTIFQQAEEGSYILMITTSTSGGAFQVANNTDALIAYAPNGTVSIANNAVLREVTAYQISINNNAEVIYESGLADVKFSSGPGASWQIVRGSWNLFD